MTGPVGAISSELARQLLNDSTNKPHEGRVYDYYLGGTSNYAADRVFGDEQLALLPDLKFASRQNRGFLQRAVQHMIANGVRQFLDIGSGLPTQGNVHQIAERYAPGECRVVYVDRDPVASAHSHLLLEESGELDRSRAINGDFAHYRELWAAIGETGLIDEGEPVGLLMLALLHFLLDEVNPQKGVEFVRTWAAPGSFLAISHATSDGMSADATARIAAVIKNYDSASTARMQNRDRAGIREFFGDWELLDPPGIGWTPEWTLPGLEEVDAEGVADFSRAQAVAGVARKP